MVFPRVTQTIRSRQGSRLPCCQPITGFGSVFLLRPSPAQLLALSSAKPHVTFETKRMSALCRMWPPETSLVAEQSCCVLLVLSFAGSCPHTRPVLTSGKNPQLSTRGGHLLQKVNNAEEILSVPTVSIRVQAGNRIQLRQFLGFE